MGPAGVSDVPEQPIFPNLLDTAEPSGKMYRWRRAYVDALQNECRNTDDPVGCARRRANEEIGEEIVEASAMNQLKYRDYELEYIERREFSKEKREKLAKTGAAMSDGSYPIENCSDVQNAVKAYGRAPESKRAAVKKHIKSRARTLGCLRHIPDEWQSGKAEEKSNYQMRRDARMKANQIDVHLIESMGNQRIVRPDRVSSNVWNELGLEQKTVRAEALRRIIERNYAQAVEDASQRGWRPEVDRFHPEEYHFKKEVHTDAGPVLVRAILIRPEQELRWELVTLSQFASGSLAMQLPKGYVRHIKGAY